MQDLRPNSQDTSSFYLGNIYQILADPNTTRASLPSLVFNPPPFSPPRYAVWVNSLWFLSLVMSLSCALLATSLHQWARRYIRLTQPARCSPEKRARMRAFFADGLDEMHVPWAVEGLPTLLHLSLFLFFGGLVIFLFHIDHEVFGSVIWLIVLFSMLYVSITLLPLIRHDSPYCAPLSTPAWFLYSGIPYATFKILFEIITTCYESIPSSWTWAQWAQTWDRFNSISGHWENLSDRYRRSMLGGVERAAEETASKRLSEIDIHILDWIIGALGDDVSLEKFFEAIPGFINSKLVHNLRGHLSSDLLDRLSVVSHGFLARTWSSNLVSDSEKLRRLDITMDAMGFIRAFHVSSILRNILFEHWDEVPLSIEMGNNLVRWCTSNDQKTSLYAQSIVAGILAGVARGERNDSWFTLAARVSGLAEHDLRDDIADGGDSALLVILIHLARRYIHIGETVFVVLKTLCELDINKTRPTLQHDFCTLWNEIAHTARGELYTTTPILVLQLLHRPYIILHPDTDPWTDSFSDPHFIPSPFCPSMYPSCNIDSHRSDSTSPIPVPNHPCSVSLPIQSSNSPDASPRSPRRSGSICSQQLEVEQGNITVGPPSPSNSTTTSEMGEASQDLSAIPHTSPINSGPHLTFAFPPPADVCDGSPRDGHDQNETIPMEVFHHQTQSLRLVPSPPDNASNSLEDDGGDYHGRNSPTLIETLFGRKVGGHP
jgi:hypothetical protein